MIIQEFCEKRSLKVVEETYDLVIIGGGMTGACCAITAARKGIKVALIQDRPVLGGNTSSEVRIWMLGATSHMGNNNRWSREGGVIDEILVENLHRNKEGNPLLFDMTLMDKVLEESNISLFLNTIVYQTIKRDDKHISAVKAINPQNSTEYIFNGSLFADCSGDGIVGFQSGASYCIGAEDTEVYNEGFAPDKNKYGELLGHSIVFYTKETANEVKYVAPNFAIKQNEIEQIIPKVKNPNYFNAKQHGCKFWWLEYGGRLDTIHDTEIIKFELWKVVYGIWDYIKNSGKYPETTNQTLEWVGVIPGKRESRRFIGYYTINQSDVIDQNEHYDAVSYGGWSIDLHPSDGVYSPLNGCNQWHSKGVFQIPYRSLVSKDIDNLFIGGRLISASHVAYGSTRVMCTSAHGGQAIGMAASLCVKNNFSPADYIKKENIGELQQNLINSGQYIPTLDIRDKENLLLKATLSSSSQLNLKQIPFDGSWFKLDYPAAQLIPMDNTNQQITIEVEAKINTTLIVQLRSSSKTINFTPDIIHQEIKIELSEGISRPEIKFDSTTSRGLYVFICFGTNPHVSLRTSNMLLTGSTSVFNYINPAVSNYGKQEPPIGIGIDAFEFWCPKRRPNNVNLAMSFSNSLKHFSHKNLLSSYYRPSNGVNAWVADLDDKNPLLTINFESPKKISSIRLFFDTDSDHAMENVQMGHFDSEIPLCVRNYKVYDDSDKLLFDKKENYQTINDIEFDNFVTKSLKISLEHPSKNIPASLFGIIIH